MATLSFPVKENIPKQDFHLFVMCNSNDFAFKQTFYDFKSQILRKYGKQDGYDLQIIKKECHSCDGTGKFKSYWKLPETCWSCGGDGIYAIKQIPLRRFILNEFTFHEPAPEVSIKETLYHSTIKGYIRHENIEGNTTYAYARLLYKYDKERFIRLLASIGSCQYGKARWKWKIKMRNAKTQLHGFANWLGVKEKELDDLPF